jgi:phosphatidylserine/phosphatidylglycerophosphate/cardiolipin synthase-like enzyme
MKLGLKFVGFVMAIALIASGAEPAFADEESPSASASATVAAAGDQSSTDATATPSESATTTTPTTSEEPTSSAEPDASASPSASESNTAVPTATTQQIAPAELTYRPRCDQLPAYGLGEAVALGQDPDRSGWTPVEGAVFSDPNTDAGAWAVVNQMLYALQTAKAGTNVRIAMYSNTRMEAASTIIRAYCRGVNIHYVTDDHGMTFAASKLVKTFLSQANTGSSFKACYLSCSSNYTWRKARLRVVTTINPLYRPYMHAKYLTFDNLNGVKYVSMLSSGNFTATQMWNGWNNIYTAVNDKTTFDFLNNRFAEMVKDSSGNDYAVKTSKASPTKVTYFFPWGVKNPRSSKQTVTSKTDPYAHFLDKIKCKGMATGYGNSKHRTEVLVSMYQWTSSRLYLARRLKALKNRGCDVRVLMSAGEWDLEVMPILRKRSSHGNIPIRNGDRGDNFIHSKFIIVNGRVGSNKTAKFVWTGSGNFTKSSLRFSNETSILITGSTVYSQFKSHWNKLWSSKYSKPITKLKKKKTVRADQ